MIRMGGNEKKLQEAKALIENARMILSDLDISKISEGSINIDNSFEWGADGRIHIATDSGIRELRIYIKYTK